MTADTETRPELATPAQPAKGLSISSLVLSLVSIPAGFTFVLPVIALVLGLVGLRMEPEGRAYARIGVVISSVILAIWIVVVVVVVVLLANVVVALVEHDPNVVPLG